MFASTLFPMALAHAGEPTFMSSDWAEATCEAWNKSQDLTAGLGESGWAENNGEKGYKIMKIYRSDCETAPQVELHISYEGGLAKCTYGGAATGANLSKKVDYTMWADTGRWQEMGRGDYGPMKAMLTSRLKFSGPQWEAMGNMGPFAKFLTLVGAVPSDANSCPTN